MAPWTNAQIVELLNRTLAEDDDSQRRRNLEALREAPVTEPFNGPAILSGRASAVFFHEVLGHRLEGQRQRGDEEGQTFTKLLGKPILPSFISVVDDPTLTNFEGIPLSAVSTSIMPSRSSVAPPSTGTSTTSTRPISLSCCCVSVWCRCPRCATHRFATSKMKIELPWRIVPHVLRVAAFEVSDPIAGVVLV